MVMAHLWHHLYPGAQFHLKPSSFPSIQYHLILLHISYPHIKDKLVRVRTRGCVGRSIMEVLDKLDLLLPLLIKQLTLALLLPLFMKKDNSGPAAICAPDIAIVLLLLLLPLALLPCL